MVHPLNHAMKGIGIITLNATRFNPNWERKYYQSISLTKHVTVAYHDCDTIFPNPDLYGIEDARLERCTLRPARYILIRHFYDGRFVHLIVFALIVY